MTGRMHIVALVSTLFVVAISGLGLSGCGGGGPIINPPPGDDPNQGQPKDYGSRQVLYGDPHIHTSYSDGDESPDFAIRYARDVSDLDWCCLTDHSEHFKSQSLAGLGYYRTVPEKFDRPGTFCVLFGYEWTSLIYGHRNVYTLDKYLPLFPSSVDSFANIEDFWTAIEPYECFTVPHHPMMASTEIWWEHTNPGVETCVEFYSKWGLSLREGNDRPLANARAENGIFRAMCTGGLRYGLMAGTDTHMSRPGSNLEESRQEDAIQYSQPGLTGVWATAFTREAIYDALKHRHCYGMTGTKVSLKFSVNDYIMGCEIEANEPPTLAFEASSEEIITEVALVTIGSNGVRAIMIYEPIATSFSGQFTDDEYAGDIAYTVRVTLANTDFALATPVWVDWGE